MKSIVTFCAILTFGVACQQSNPALEKKIDDLTAKVDQLAEKAAKAPGAAAPAAPRPAPNRPDPNAVYAVPVEGAPFDGPEHAKVTIVKAFEYACPFCLRAKPTMEQLIKDYGKDVKVVYKQFVVHPQSATTPALAACAAHKQGKFPQMNKLIWDKGYSAGRNFSKENMEALAKEAGLDVKKFSADLDGTECKNQLQEGQKQLSQVGTRGTPNFYINGRPLSGAQPIGNFKKIVDEELKKANEAIKAGAKVETYYTEHVLKKGKKSL